jgi:hypothetical protein
MGLDEQAGSRDRFTLGWVRTVSIRPGEPADGVGGARSMSMGPGESAGWDRVGWVRSVSIGLGERAGIRVALVGRGRCRWVGRTSWASR